jgi:hypothetical protein
MRRQLGLVKFIGGQNKAAMLVDKGLSGRHGGGQGPLDLVHDLVGLRISPRASLLAIARLRTHRARVQEGGLQPLRKRHQRLPRIRFTRKGGAAPFLQGFDFLGTLLAALLVDGTLRLRLAGLRGDKEPALVYAAIR